jgi:hypothetical protein
MMVMINSFNFNQQENYSYGTQFVTINLAYILSTPVAAYIFLPVFYRLQSASVYRCEYRIILQERV